MCIENPSKVEIKEILQRAKTIAVVGLSDKPDKTSYIVAKVLQDSGYRIIPVNPTISEVLGEKAVSSLTDIKEHVDIVNIFRGQQHLPNIAKQFDQIDADVFWSQLGIENKEAYIFLKEKGYTVIMDRCIKVEHALIK